MLMILQGTPPSSQQKGHAGKRVFQSKLHVDYCAATIPQVRVQWRQPPVNIATPVLVALTVVYRIPKSWPRAAREAASGRWKTSIPDGDNVAKTVLDCLKGIVVDDDSQVQWESIHRIWGDTNYSVVRITIPTAVGPEAL